MTAVVNDRNRPPIVPLFGRSRSSLAASLLSEGLLEALDEARPAGLLGSGPPSGGDSYARAHRTKQ